VGHTVSPSGVITDPEKLDAVKSWSGLNDKHQLKSFRSCVHTTGGSLPDLRLQLSC
jgi:hypothetical protein